MCFLLFAFNFTNSPTPLSYFSLSCKYLAKNNGKIENNVKSTTNNTFAPGQCIVLNKIAAANKENDNPPVINVSDFIILSIKHSYS